MARYLIDTNVLLRGAVRTSARKPVAVNAIAALLAQGDELYVAPQVLMEFWSVATRPTDVNGFGWSVEVVRGKVDKLLEQFPLLPETPAVFEEWLRLVTERCVTGKRAHDTRLVALLRNFINLGTCSRSTCATSRATISRRSRRMRSRTSDLPTPAPAGCYPLSTGH